MAIYQHMAVWARFCRVLWELGVLSHQILTVRLFCRALWELGVLSHQILTVRLPQNYTYFTMLYVTISVYAFYVCSYSSFQVKFPACWLYQSDFGVTGPSDSRRVLQNSILKPGLQIVGRIASICL